MQSPYQNQPAPEQQFYAQPQATYQAQTMAPSSPGQQYNAQPQEQYQQQAQAQPQQQVQQPQQQQQSFADMIDEQEQKNGVRLSWNAFPTNAADAKNALIVPLGVMYSPMKAEPAVAQVPYEPVMCRCRAILNPYCQVDIAAKTWSCPFCLNRNQLPPQYNGISASSLPAELYPQYATMEYVLPRPAKETPAFLMVVDTGVIEDDFGFLKEGLLQFINLIPEESRVGLITVGTNTAIYDLSSQEIPKSYIFSGSSPLPVEKVKELLFPVQGANQGFLMPLSQCEFTLTSLIEDLERDPWPVPSNHRPLRSTGVALALAVGVLEHLCRGVGGRIVSFLSGPCTHGQGLIVGTELKEMIRSHHDITKNLASHLKEASVFYNQLANHLVTNGHTHDTFMCSLDQCGLLEMAEMSTKTGGLIMLSSTFNNEMFTKSLVKCFEKNEKNEMTLAFNAMLEMHVSRGIKICGAIGSVSSLQRKAGTVSDSEIGVGGTNAWRMSSLDPNTTIGFYLQIGATPEDGITSGMFGLLQFVTHYQLSSGKFLLRVTTIARPFVDAVGRIGDICASFDQEAATALMARVATLKANKEDNHDVLRWIDRMLIMLCKKYGNYNKGDSNSFSLPQNISLYPGFMFHLRRSNYIQPFNNSPDESVWYRWTLDRESVANTILMIQPQLDSYIMGNPEPMPAPLSAQSIVPESILLMDSFFFVVVFYGHKVSQWKREGYAEKPEHAEFKRVITQPVIDAKALMKDRFPYPKYIECVQYSGDSRFLTSVVDPSVTHTNSHGKSGEAVFTEDVNLTVFMDHLRRLVVKTD
jgi:protein transport protein SEC23